MVYPTVMFVDSKYENENDYKRLLSDIKDFFRNALLGKPYISKTEYDR